jgi:hypothetical protein
LKLACRVALSIVFGFAGLSLASCSKVLYAPMYQTGTISHVVVITLKNHGNADDRMKIIEASRELRKIRGVYDVEVGTVLPSSRPIVISDYDVALVVTFRDEASMQAYVTDPRHVKLQKEVLEPLVAPNGVKVYDFVNHE